MDMVSRSGADAAMLLVLIDVIIIINVNGYIVVWLLVEEEEQ